MLECVANVSEGDDKSSLRHLTESCGSALLDVHTDRWHHRSVFTLAGPDVINAIERLARRVVDILDIRQHAGVHPRIGMLDVVPFVPLAGSTLDEAIAARNAFADWLALNLGVPCFLYGPERQLPEIRRGAFTEIAPDIGPPHPHERAGACAVGARPPLIAYNLWLREGGVARAREIATAIRRPGLRTLGLDLEGAGQVSCNLIDPGKLGPADAYDLVAEHAEIERAELVGLVPSNVLETIPSDRWEQLDLSTERTIEARLEQRAGLNDGEDAF